MLFNIIANQDMVTTKPKHDEILFSVNPVKCNVIKLVSGSGSDVNTSNLYYKYYPLGSYDQAD